ncbi:competence protein CoiA family protein [Halomonas sp. H5]|uniref:competence protein CoiA family protein n=1 Tax=Halomonas sp. H5 TaxID=3423910 RepID=UPI003D36CC33
MRSEEIHYAIGENRAIVSVLDLTPALHRGLRCGCVCAYCHAPLVARLGDKRCWHFAHAPGSEECGYGAETGLHLAAKQLIKEEGVITHPAHTITCTLHDLEGKPRSLSRTVAEAIPRADATDIRQEVALPGIVADVQLMDAQGPLLVEVAVSHKVDDEKRQKLGALGWRCIEIDLSRVSDRSTPAELRKALFDPERASWAYHPDTVRHAESLRAELQGIVDRANEVLRRNARKRARGTELEEMSADQLAKQIWHEKYREWQRRQGQWVSPHVLRPSPAEETNDEAPIRVHPTLEAKRRPEPTSPQAAPTLAPRLDMAAIQATVDQAVRRSPSRPTHLGVPPQSASDALPSNVQDPVLARWQTERGRLDRDALQALASDLKEELDSLQAAWGAQGPEGTDPADRETLPGDMPSCLAIPLDHEWLIAPSPPEWKVRVVQHLRQRASNGRKGGVPIPLLLASLRGHGLEIIEPYRSAQTVVDTLRYYRLESYAPELVALMTALPPPRTVLTSLLDELEEAAIIERRQLRGRMAYVMGMGRPTLASGQP